MSDLSSDKQQLQGHVTTRPLIN